MPNNKSKNNSSNKSKKNNKPNNALNNSSNKASNKASNKSNTDKKEKFDESTVTYSDLIDLFSVSATAEDKNNVTWQDQLRDYGVLVLKYLFLVTILTLNFLGLSVSLNCNADSEYSKRIMSAIFAFFFGFVYLIINYYTYKVLSQGKICKMDREKLFPFKS